MLYQLYKILFLKQTQFKDVSQFNPSCQLSTRQLLTPSPQQDERTELETQKGDNSLALSTNPKHSPTVGTLKDLTLLQPKPAQDVYFSVQR